MASTKSNDDVYGAQTVYRELAYYITRREEYARALPYFDEAVTNTPTDKRALMGRALARSKACQYTGALEDIAKALKQDPEDLVSIASKALNTYLCCEFEDALVLNLRMVTKRKKPDNFTMGVMHCNEAIENCVGARAGRPLRDHFKIIRRLAWKKVRDAEKPFQPKTKYKKKKKKKKATTKKIIREPVIPIIRSKATKSAEQKSHNKVEIMKTDGGEGRNESDTKDLCIYDSLHTLQEESDYVPPGKPFPFRPIQRYTTNIENYMAEKYLDSLYLDKIFLKNLKNNVGVTSPNKEGVNRTLRMAKEGYKTLAYKQELLRTRKPFYFIKYQEAKLSGALKARMNAELKKIEHAAKRDADSLLDKIKTAIEEKQTKVALENAEKLKAFCDLKPKKVLPMRDEYLNELYKLIGKTYYQLFRLNKNQFAWDQEKRIYDWLGMPLSRQPSTDSVITQFKDVFIDWKKQIPIYEERLRKATSLDEMAWLYHELSRCHSELKQFELARVYARKCMKEGRAAKDNHWIVNAVMMISKINMQQHNRNDSKVEFNKALTIAKGIDDPTLIEYIEKCLDIVEKIDFCDNYGSKVLEKREKQIIQMMIGAALQGEVTHLFKKMGAMPATRRMSVMPGVTPEDTGDKIAPSARKMSILPGTRPQEDQPPSHVLKAEGAKKATKDVDGRKGIAFMELIKYHVDL